STQIAIEYNYEKAMGDLNNFGNSHEITLAYKFNNNKRYRYSGDDEESALLIKPARKPSRPIANRSTAPRRATQPKQTAPTPTEPTETIQQEPQTGQEEVVTVEEQQQAVPETVNEEQLQIEQAQQEALAKAEAERIKQAEEDAARAKAAEEARLLAAQRALEAEAKAKAEAEEAARLLAEQEAKAKAEAEEAARLLAQQEAEAKAQAEEEARLKQEEQTVADTNETINQGNLDDVAIQATGGNRGRAMQELTELTADSRIKQQELLVRLRETVASREQDLKDLKQENDLSEQGIYTEPKPFKSISEQDAALEAIKIDLDNAIKTQGDKIAEIEKLNDERRKTVRNANDSINASYLSMIQTLKAEQMQAINTKESLLATLETIKEATEIERKRRIKRAAYDNEQDRYAKDRATLNTIKQNTPLSATPYNESDFDFGEEQSNIQILKGIANVDNGYYLVLAVHSDVEKRDDFLRKVVASGEGNIDFFFDVATNKYYIYKEKFDTIGQANNVLQNKGNKPYNSKIAIVKIED